MNPDEVLSNGQTIARILSFVFIAMLVVLWLSGGILRKRLNDRNRVWLTCTTTVLIPLVLLAHLYSRHGEEFAVKGLRAPGLRQGVQILETYLLSEVHAERNEERFSIAVLGDSTHFYSMKAEQEFLPQLRQSFPDALQSEIELYGLRQQGLDAFGYYFLSHRLVKEEPDMILVPVNLRSFSMMWAGHDQWRYPSLERFTPWSEIPRATTISSATRTIRWDLVAMRKLDYAWTDEHAGFFLRGTKLAFDEQLQEFEEHFETRCARLGSYIPKSWLTGSEQFFENNRNGYAEYVESDHAMIKAFRAINRLAAKHGVRMVYYPVELDRKNVRQQENFEVVEKALTQDPGVYFIDALGLMNPTLFLQREHLTAEGINLLTRYLANEIGLLIQDEIGLMDVVYERVEKNEYTTKNPLRVYTERVQAMTPTELEALLKTLEPEFVDATVDIWEKYNGPRL